jgi:hypothetical protein
MKKHSFILVICAFIFSRLNAQIGFIGFSEPVCQSPMTNVYTYSNYPLGSHGGGFIIYINGVQVLDMSNQFGAFVCQELIFLNDSTGFLAYHTPNGVRVLKTADYGSNWSNVGNGAYFLGMYIVNQNYGYLLSTFSSTVIYSTISDLVLPSILIFDTICDNDVFEIDTTFNCSLCNIDSLTAYVVYNSDTVAYHVDMTCISTNILTNSVENRFFKIYPNPTRGIFEVALPIDFVNENNLTLSIYDNTGKFIQQKTLEMNDGKIKLNLEAEAKGVYNVTLSNKKKSYSGKIVFE